MEIKSQSFDADQRIPDEFVFAKPDPEMHATLSDNKNPHLAWSGVPAGCKTLALICVDPDVPTVGDDVNQEGRTVPADLPRTDFFHWVMVDISATCRSIEAGSCSDGVAAKGKRDPSGPAGARQGLNDFGGWFGDDPDMGGDYHGYDGPGPPWNDALLHHYEFQLFALDLERCPVEGGFSGSDVRAALEGHVLAQATVAGTYTTNPDLI
jgi:Raf kinase inhibitor-like YbhB/YbcL family protein